MSSNHEIFEYTYSASEQKEVEAIKSKYVKREETTLEKIKRLDKEAEKPGTIISIILGVLGALVMGLGLSMCLTGTNIVSIPGIIFGTVGIGMIALAYPVYSKITKKERERIAPEILALMKKLGV